MVDVLIVGAGPAGLFLAYDLLRRGVSCRIIDQSAAPASTSRALGITPRTLEIFELAGIAADFVRAGYAVRGAWLNLNGLPAAHLSFEEIDSAYRFVLMLPQSRTEEILTRHLTQLGGKVERGTQLLACEQDQEGVRVTVRTPAGAIETEHSQWLAGCDGAHSAVRHALNLHFAGAAYAEGFVLADVDLRSSLPGDELSLNLSKDGMLALLPYGAGSFRMVSNVAADDRHEPDRGELQALLDARLRRESTIERVNWVSNFRIHRRIVPQMHVGRVFLAGDAAHIHSPAGGQGMNTALGDVWNLSWKLALVCREVAPRNVLLSYSAERLPIARAVLRATNMLTQAATVRNPILRGLRDAIAPALLRGDGLRRRGFETLAEVHVAYPHSPIVIGDGRRVPDVRLREKGSGMVGPLYGLLGSKHVLLIWTPPKEAAPDDLIVLGSALKRRYGEHLDVFTVESAAPLALLTLIRPDGYVGFAGMQSDARRLQDQLADLFREASPPTAG